MKEITIDNLKYNIDCNALTYVKYMSFFQTGILKDLDVIRNYLIKQSIIAKQLESEHLEEAEMLNQISNIMRDDMDEFITILTRITWILIYTADNKIDDYETWLKNIKRIKLDEKWIAEVTEYAVKCFR